MAKRPGRRIVEKKKPKKTKFQIKNEVDPSDIDKRGLYIIGLDISLTSTGISVISPSGKFVGSEVVTTDRDGYNSRMDRINYIIEKIYSVLNSYKNKYVVIEHYAFGKYDSAYTLAELGGAIRYTLYKDGIEFLEVVPTVLKKFFTGSGNAKKEDIKAWIYKRYNVEFMDKTNDEADAFVCAVYGFNKLFPNREVKKLEKN